MRFRKHFFWLLPVLCLLLMQSCTSTQKKKTDWELTLDHDHKTPYGSYLAYESLPRYFPAAKREYLNKWFRYTSIDPAMINHGDSTGLLVMCGFNLYVSSEEWNSVMQFAKAGNEVVVFASLLDNNIEQALRCRKQFNSEEVYAPSQMEDGSGNIRSLCLLPDSAVRYGYTGRSLKGYFETEKPAGDSTSDTSALGKYFASPTKKKKEITDEETEEETYDYSSMVQQNPEILGRNKYGTNFIRYTVGNGHITLHAAPLVLSNYFLLQDGNTKYLDGIWHTLPDNINVVYWNEFYNRTTKSGGFGILWKYAAIRWAILLALFTLLVYVLFGLKKRQRTIPVIPPLQNTSASFVETIGRLYFNKGNHGNLASKMVQQFLEWVRANYFIDTNHLDDHFSAQLIAKSGKPAALVQDLMQHIHFTRGNDAAISDDYLYELYELIQSFYGQPKH